jgi:16S rRNA (cytosine967-C5)-methyltransferase
MIAPARAAAFHILLKVSTTDGHSDELLRAQEVDALTAQDRALTTTLVMGTLRWQLKLDARIRALLARPDAKLAPAVETALRLGAYQLLYLDRIPAHAAIGESVELAKVAGERFASGMVNAVLRKLVRLPRATTQGEQGSAAEVADAYAHPQWMVERWVQNYGLEITAAVCHADQEPASTHLRLLYPDAKSSLADEGVELEAGEFLTTARRVVSGDVLRSAAFQKGWIRIQDEGSQLVAELGGHGRRILDVCAAPGGKTAILVERNPDAEITAYDVSRRRLEAMRRGFANGKERVRFEVQDATAMELPPEYDLILCDVPCTGTGTIGRNPEIRFRVSEEEIARQQARQVKILSRALEGLAPGGRLMYSTCSLEPEENDAVVKECLERRHEVRLVALYGEVERLEGEGVLHADGAAKLKKSALSGGYLRTLPGIHRCDGFYAALIVRD